MIQNQKKQGTFPIHDEIKPQPKRKEKKKKEKKEFLDRREKEKDWIFMIRIRRD